LELYRAAQPTENVKDPNDSWFFVNWASALIEKAKILSIQFSNDAEDTFTEALQKLKISLELNPKETAAIINLVATLVERAKWNRKRNDISKFSQIETDLNEAIRRINELIKEDKENEAALLNKSSATLELGRLKNLQGNSKDAINLFTILIKLISNKSSDALKYNAAVACIQLNKYDDCFKLLEEIKDNKWMTEEDFFVLRDMPQFRDLLEKKSKQK